MYLRPTGNASPACSVFGALIVLLFVGFGSLDAQEVDNASARAYNAAAALQNAGLHSRASEKWKAFIDQFPNDDRLGKAHYFLGVSQLRDQKFDEATQAFRTVLSRWPNIPQADRAQYNLAMARYEVASKSMDDNQFRDAAKEFSVVSAKYAQSEFADDARYYQGDCLFTVGDLPAAVIAYQQLIAKHASSSHAPRAYYDLGIAQQELNKLPDAANTFQAFLAKPEYASHDLAPEIRLRWAVCLHGTDKLEAAAAQFAKAAETKGFELAPYASFRLGQTYLQQSKHKQAAQHLKDFANKNRDSEYHADALKLAGQGYFLANDFQNAINVLTPIAKTNDPPAAEASYWLSRSLAKKEQPEQALRVTERAIGAMGNHPFVSHLKFERINAMYQIPQRRNETAGLYEAFVRENADHPLAPQASYRAALASFGQQQYAKSRQMAENYLVKYANENADIAGELHYIAAESYLLENPTEEASRDKAESLYRKLVAEHPDHVRAARSQLRIGWCLQSAKKHQDSINHLQAFLAKFDKQTQLPEAQLLIGSGHGSLDRHRDAINAFNAVINANGKWERIDEVFLASATSHQTLNELDQAVAMLRRIVDSQPQSELKPQALYRLGQIEQSRDKVDDARNWFKAVVDQFAQSEFSGPSMHALASIHLGKKEYPATRDWSSRLMNSKASDELKQRARFLRGLAHQQENSFDKAIEDLDAYRRKPASESESQNAIYALALCRVSKKNIDVAKQLVGELLLKSPDFDGADRIYYEIGHALRAQENKDKEALEAFTWITQKRPDSELAAESWFRIGQFQIQSASKAAEGEKNALLEKAEKSLASGIEKTKEPKLQENIRYLLGDTQFQRLQFVRAAQTLQKQIADFPQGKYVGPATFLAASAKVELGQFDQALPMFTRIADLSFGDTAAEQVATYRSQSLYRAGDCAAKLNRWAESQQIFQKLIDQFQQFPQRPEAHYAIAHAMQQQNQLAAAIKAYEHVTTQTESETAAKARFMIGEIEFGRKKYEDAIEQFLLVTVGYPYESWQALARFETARCFIELGDKTRAEKTLREMIEKHPQHDRVGDAQKILQDLSK